MLVNIVDSFVRKKLYFTYLLCTSKQDDVAVSCNLAFLFNVGLGFFLCNADVTVAATGYYVKVR